MNTLSNHVQLIGRIGNEIELKTLTNGTKMTRISLATNEYYIDKKGEKQQKTYWHNVVAWGKQAENINKLATKGEQLAISGKLINRSYDEPKGETKFITEVSLNEFIKLN